MKFGLNYIVSIFILSFFCIKTYSQTREIKIALLASFYLENNFDSSYKFNQKKGIIKESFPAIEFFEGASFSIDSLQKEGIDAKLHAFDIQSKDQQIDKLISTEILSSFDLIIGQVAGTDYLKIAEFSKKYKIPFVSATYPNDGGISQNPLVFIANPKINSHLFLLHNQIENKWPKAKIIWFHRNDTLDLKLLNIFEEINTSNGDKPLKINKALLPSVFTMADVVKHIDTTINENLLIVGSFNEAYMTQLAKALKFYPKKGKIRIIGMPVWETLKEIQNKEYSSIPIFYTTGFFPNSKNSWLNNFDSKFKSEMGIRSPPLAAKSFELIYYFSHLIDKYGTINEESLKDENFRIMTNFVFKGIQRDPNNSLVDYFENKNIYFVRKLNGVTSIQ